MSGYSAHIDRFVAENLPPEIMQPQFLFDLPELQFPERMNAATLLDVAVARGLGDKTAILFGDQAITYAALLDQSCRIAALLTEDFGLVPGNRVLLHAANRPDTIAAWFAILRAGGVVVAAMPLLRARDLAPIIAKARISHALIDAALTDVVREADVQTGLIRSIATLGPSGDLMQRAASKSAGFAPVETAADDAALIAFTSGTTGKPKGCVQFHRDIQAIVETFCRHVLKPRPDDVFCGTPPFAFTFGLGGSVIFPFAVGATTALPERPGYEALMETIQQQEVSVLFTAPTAYRAMLATGGLDKLKSLRLCVSAGEPLFKGTSDAWFEATGLRIIDGIGSTEMMHIFISASGEDIRPGATGRATPGYTACVLDEANRPAPAGSTGRLAIRGPTGCRYLADERQAAYVVDGWNVTGDIYRHDADGYFTFLARADDMIVSAGYNIAAPEVEQALLLHPDVAEAAVIAAPDPQRGQICKAFVVLRPGAPCGDEAKGALQAFVKATIAPYKYPRAVEFVTALPKTDTGKLQRFKLRTAV